MPSTVNLTLTEKLKSCPGSVILTFLNNMNITITVVTLLSFGGSPYGRSSIKVLSDRSVGFCSTELIEFSCGSL